MIGDDLTLGQIKLLQCQPEFSALFSKCFVQTYDEFLELLYKQIDLSIDELQSNAELLRKDGEDRLTVSIKSILKAKGFDVTHDEKHRGHCDLLVKLNSFRWIGEAKIHHDYDYLLKGFNQLCTRYSTGDTNQNSGGMIIYIKGKDAKTVMDSWNKRIVEEKFTEFSSKPCPKRELNFLSSHLHGTSGLSFNVRHMPVLLHFDPQDK